MPHAAVSAATRQQAGWLAISCAIALIWAEIRTQTRIDATHSERAYTPIVRQADRLNTILERLSNGGSVAVSDLAADLQVSAATVRRDLGLLEAQHLLSRTHGGAVARGLVYELPLRYKGARHLDEKRRIAAAAAERVADGMAIGLTGGTTTTEVARALASRRITVVTNALNIAGELAVRPYLKLIVTGGVVRSESYELVGPLAEASIAELNLDLVFLGVDGVDPTAGLTTPHEGEAHTNASLIERAQRVIVIADRSKLGRVAFARICGFERIHELITDAGADPAIIARLEDAGVPVSAV